MDNLQEEVLASLIRLPLAALLGTALALGRARGTPSASRPSCKRKSSWRSSAR